MYLADRMPAGLGLALALTLVVASATGAQVATLVEPGASPTPAPEEAAQLEFTDRTEALLAFAQCMRDQGVEMDDPQPGAARGGARLLRPEGPRGLDELDEGFTAARDACVHILEAARPELDPVAEQERLETQLRLAQCIREGGYPDYPDPALDADGRLQRSGGRVLAELGIDVRSEAFAAVLSTCVTELGLAAVGPGRGSPPGGPGGSDPGAGG